MILPIALVFALNVYSADVTSGITTAYYNTTLTTSSGIISDDPNSTFYLESFALTSEIIYGFNLVTFGSAPNEYYIGLTSIRIDSYLSILDQGQIYPDDYLYSWSHTIYSYNFEQQGEMPIWANPDNPFGYNELEDMEDLHLYLGIHKTQGYAIQYVIDLEYKGWDLYEGGANIPSYLDNVHTLVDFESDISFADTGNIVYEQIEHYWHTLYFPDVNASYQEGYDVGYADGSRSGYNSGFTDGYNDGSSQSEVATSIFLGIINIALLPINMFLKMLNFEVFGINIGGFVSALLTVAIAVILIRIIFGGNKSGS